MLVGSRDLANLATDSTTYQYSIKIFAHILLQVILPLEKNMNFKELCKYYISTIAGCSDPKFLLQCGREEYILASAFALRVSAPTEIFPF